MEKILELLGIQQLDESKRDEIKQMLQDLIDLRVKEQVAEEIEQEKKTLVESYETKFDEYKEDITAKFSNFVDEILDEEVKIPENVLEYARKGELYEDVIETLKTKISIDEGTLEEEAKNLLREAKEEIKSLRDEVNDLYSKKMQLESDAKELSASLYIRQKCDGLTESQKTKVIKLLEGISNRNEIDRKYKLVLETIGSVNEEDTNTCVCPECGKTQEVKGACNMAECPDCEVKLKDKGSDAEGDGVSEVDNREGAAPLNEDSPFSKAVKVWASRI